ncbi:MAG: excinuclease subunit [Verrucomicrobiota bacterium]
MAKKERPDLTKKVHEVPHKPGVYLMRDRFNRVIYVGKARDLRKRVGSYFMPSKLAQADIKTRAMLDAVWDFETHTVQSEPESILLEGKLIKEYRPRYNISFRDDKRFLVVKVDPTEEWPRFRLARFKKDDGARYFGPYAHAGALRQTLNFMRKKFGVLTFGRGSPTERELKSATYQVPTRLSDISAELYRERVAQACDFLEGHSREMITAVEEEMLKAAEKLDFEKAADLRNMLEDLRRTTKPTRRFTRHSLPSSIDPASDVRALGDALQLSRLPSVMECFDISNISTTHVVASMVCFRNGVPDKDNYRRYRIRTVEGQDDFASMAEVVRRRYSRVLLEAREANPDVAEFSQENPKEALERAQRISHPERSASEVEGPRGIAIGVALIKTGSFDSSRGCGIRSGCRDLPKTRYRAFDVSHRDVRCQPSRSDFRHHHKSDLASREFLIEPKRVPDFLLRKTGRQSRRQLKRFQRLDDSIPLGFTQPRFPHRDFASRDHSETDGFAMEKIAILPHPLDSMPNGVTEIQEGSLAGRLAFVRTNDPSFDFDIPANQRLPIRPVELR